MKKQVYIQPNGVMLNLREEELTMCAALSDADDRQWSASPRREIELGSRGEIGGPTAGYHMRTY